MNRKEKKSGFFLSYNVSSQRRKMFAGHTDAGCVLCRYVIVVVEGVSS